MLIDAFKPQHIAFNRQQTAAEAPVNQEPSSFLPNVRNKRMHNEYNTLLQSPRRYDQSWVENTMKNFK